MNMKRIMKKLLGGGVALALSMAMALGIFAGTGMDVKAADEYCFESYDLPNDYSDFLKKNFIVGSTIDSSDMEQIAGLISSTSSKYILGKDGEGDIVYLLDEEEKFITNETTYNTEKDSASTWFILRRNSSSPSGSTTPIDVPWYYEQITLGDYTAETLYDAVGKHGQNLHFSDTGKTLAEGADVLNNSICIWNVYAGSNGYVFFYFVKNNQGQVYYNGKGIDDSAMPYADLHLCVGNDVNIYILKPKNTESSGSAETSGSGTDAYTYSHTHSYSWVTVQDVSSEQDGIEEYRCSCGDVQERCVIPRYMAIVKGLFGEIKDAPQNGTATFDSGRLYTISDYVIKKLAERTDVTTVITFEYQNRFYKMTIPAGADFTGLLADEEYFYGYFYFANAVGATIEAI